MRIKFEASSRRHSKGQITALFILLLLFLADFWAAGLPDGALFPQWDKSVHLTAGALVAALFFPYFGKSRGLILFVLAIGGLFEAAEFMVVSIADYGGVKWYLGDTAADLLVDALGAWIMIRMLSYFRYAG